MDHVAKDIREPEIAARMAVSELFVINPQQVEQRRMKIVDVYFTLLGIKAVLIGGSMAGTTFYTATGHPHGKAPRVVIATVVIRALHRGWAAVPVRHRGAMCQCREGFTADQDVLGDAPHAVIDLGNERAAGAAEATEAWYHALLKAHGASVESVWP